MMGYSMFARLAFYVVLIRIAAVWLTATLSGIGVRLVTGETWIAGLTTLVLSFLLWYRRWPLGARVTRWVYK